MVQIRTKKSFKKYVVDKFCKHQSYTKLSRYYVLQYKNDKTFSIKTYDSSIFMGETTGIYKLKQTKNNLKVLVKYDEIFESPYIQSTFNKENKYSIYKSK